MQCLRTGQVSLGSHDVEGCQDDCCKKPGQVPLREELPSPCGDEYCCLLITLDAVEPPALVGTSPDLVAIAQPAATGVEFAAPRGQMPVAVPQPRPPDRQPVPLTVLFSSFLI